MDNVENSSNTSKNPVSGNECQNKATKIDNGTLDNLCKGFTELYVDDLKALANPLDELQRNQEVSIECILRENDRFLDATTSLNLQEMFSSIAFYQAKLISIKKDMVSLHEKSQKLKKRALKLKTMKEKQLGKK